MHPGFEQLAIICEKRGQTEEALRLSQEAQRQGWNGGWEGRIERLSKKTAKL